MSMSTYIRGIVPPDEEWQKMKAIWDSCKIAGIEAPNEVFNYFEMNSFGDGKPDPKGMSVELPCKEWRAEMGEGYELLVSDIPEKVKIIRFYNSW